MKKAFIVTSALNVDNANPLTYSDKRTHFGTDDRIRHTAMTVATLDMKSDDNTVIYLLDCSAGGGADNSNLFGYQKNLRFINVATEFPEIYQQVTTHPNKSHCECLMLAAFMRKYRTELLAFDFIFKISGRYFTDSSFDTTVFNKYNRNKIFYKTPLEFDWSDSWGYNIVDRREQQGDNKLRQYCSVLYGWGNEHFDHFLDMYTAVACMLDLPSMIHMDIETLGYYFMRPFERDIIETDWIVYGWDGTSGRFMRY